MTLAMHALFADANFYIAAINPRDQLHQRALTIAREIGQERPILTTDFVLVEVCRFMARKGDFFRQRALTLVASLRANPQVTVVPASRGLFDDALDVYRAHHDKTWDLVDCGS